MPEGLASNDGVALNKGNICIAKTSPPEVQKAYYTQFKRDFTLFLRSRAREVVPGGCMVLTFLGSIQSTDPHPMHELLGCTLHQMALEVTSKCDFSKDFLDSNNAYFFLLAVATLIPFNF